MAQHNPLNPVNLPTVNLSQRPVAENNYLSDSLELSGFQRVNNINPSRDFKETIISTNMLLKLPLSKSSSESKAPSSSSFDSLKSIGSCPVSSVTIPLTLSSFPRVNSNDDFNSILSLNKVTPQNDNLSLFATLPV
ncbi:4509_t:CDS:2 [Dentiscutata erythropus]|uniref:4509_t:CDS:1 n=1 Tax=Dentiscutata erythropus TaxID=1348616 RepID=A0A9N9HR02_9GLOM|nr:4509_t:CDS:2 [Dentiscutata erythropus]